MRDKQSVKNFDRNSDRYLRGMTRMLNSFSLNIYRKLIVSLSLLVLLLFVASCLPQATSPSVNSSGSTNPNNASSNGTVYKDPTFTQSGIFLQEGALQTTGVLTLPLNFTDSFLIRGTAITQYLRTVPSTTNFCIV